jgi:hypothetical protein
MITHIRHTTVGRTPLDEGPARRRDLYLTTHNTHKRQTSIPPVGFEPTILVSERPKTHVLDRTATGIGHYVIDLVKRKISFGLAQKEHHYSKTASSSDTDKSVLPRVTMKVYRREYVYLSSNKFCELQKSCIAFMWM